MKSGIFKYLAVWSLIFYSIPIRAQYDSARYDRPSLCLMMVARQEMAFSIEIEEVFRNMDMPERFNDHSLGVRVFKVPQDGKPVLDAIISFSEHAEIAKKMVSKWFDRDKASGCFNTHLIQERGLYNATIPDALVAMQTIRGQAVLADAGEKLISRTFLVVNEYKYKKTYSSKKDNSSQEISKDQLDISNQQEMDAYNEQLHGGGRLLSEFSINCTSYLFQLDWTEDVSGTFYHDYYFSCSEPTPEKIEAFKQDKKLFRLSYVGMYSDKLSEKNTHHLTTPKLVKKVCVRITDRNIAKLQHQFPQFRIKASLQASEENENIFKAYVGLKEDIKPSSSFEVLEPELLEDGTYTYKRVGVIQPIDGRIWDNRFMATDEIEQELDATYFKQISGGQLYPGLLIREM